MKKLSYGIVGGGFITSFQLQALRQIQGIEVAGFVSKEPVDHLTEFVKAHHLGAGLAYESIARMAEDSDLIAIFAPNFARIEIMEEVVKAQKNGAGLKGVICEKPLARNMAEARKLIALAKEANLVTAYFENQVHMKSIQASRSQLGPVMDKMGAPMLVRSSEEHAGPHKPWFWDPVTQGGGVMSDMGCHCLAVGWYGLTPPGKPVDFLIPQSVTADLSLLKWGRKRWREMLLKDYGVDYSAAPAEDFATGCVTYLNPETKELSKAQFTVSWMFDKQGLRLLYDGLGPGYAFEMNTLRSPLELFISDAAGAETADQEAALEKSQSSTGLLTVQPNEADLYGYTDENLDLFEAVTQNRPPLLDWEYGLKIVRLTMAAYLSAERNCVVDLTDKRILEELETYVPLIQKGQGAKILIANNG